MKIHTTNKIDVSFDEIVTFVLRAKELIRSEGFFSVKEGMLPTGTQCVGSALSCGDSVEVRAAAEEAFVAANNVEVVADFKGVPCSAWIALWNDEHSLDDVYAALDRTIEYVKQRSASS